MATTPEPSSVTSGAAFNEALVDYFVPIPFHRLGDRRLPRGAHSNPCPIEIFTEAEQNAILLSVKEDTLSRPVVVHTTPRTVPPRNPKYVMTLIVDLDETLVDARGCYLAIRPYARQFFELIRAHLPRVEVGAWTAGIPAHAERVCRLFELDNARGVVETGAFFDFVIARGGDWYDEQGPSPPYKDVFRLRGRGPTSLILDDSVHVTRYSGMQAIIIEPFAVNTASAISDNALIYALQVIAFVNHALCEHRWRSEVQPTSCELARRCDAAQTRAEEIFDAVVNSVVFEYFEPCCAKGRESHHDDGAHFPSHKMAASTAIFERALDEHPFIERSDRKKAEYDECFLLQTDPAKITSMFCERRLMKSSPSAVFNPESMTYSGSATVVSSFAGPTENTIRVGRYQFPVFHRDESAAWCPCLAGARVPVPRLLLPLPSSSDTAPTRGRAEHLSVAIKGLRSSSMRARTGNCDSEFESSSDSILFNPYASEPPASSALDSELCDNVFL